MSGSGGAPASSDRAVLGIAVSVIAALGASLLDLWLASGFASLVSTGSWTPVALSPPSLVRTLLTQGIAPLAHDAPGVFWTVLVLLAAVEIVAGTLVAAWLSRWFSGMHDPSRLARRRDLGDLTGKQAAAKAQGLRSSLSTTTELDSRDIGIPIMYAERRNLMMSWEDFGLFVMGPRSNKTSAIVVPAILSARGPVVATGNKPDVWSLTKDLRQSLFGPIYTFDPMLVAYAEQEFYLDPVAWVRGEHPDRQFEHAQRFIGHFTGGIKSERSDPFFANAAERVAVAAMLAAVVDPNGTLRDVLDFLSDSRRDAVATLDAHGASEDASELEKTLNGADVTAEGIFETARTGLKALRSEALLRWVTPPRAWRRPPQPGDKAIPEFDPWSLFVPHEDGTVPTLYVLSKDGGANASAVITALVDRIADLGERTASARGGRLDPPVEIVLDEAANICPLQNLPKFASHWGSRGLATLTILQNYKQGAGVWGREGMDALWSAATVKMVGAGVEDTDFLSSVSQLIGDHWVAQPPSVSVDRRGGGSDQHAATKEPIFPISRLRQLPKTEGLLLTPGRPVIHGTLKPWYNEDVYDIAAARIGAANTAAQHEIKDAAVEHLGQSNPVAQWLAGEQASAP